MIEDEYTEVYVGMTIDELKSLLDSYIEDNRVDTEFYVEEIRDDLHTISTKVDGVFNGISVIVAIIVIIFVFRTLYSHISGIIKG
jgi:hypothetical protein